MNLVIEDTYEAMAKKAAEDLFQLLQPLDAPLICAASGASPVGLYKHLVRMINDRQTDTSNWYFVGLDEWKGMNGNDEGSCRHSLNHQLFYPLQIKEKNICFFDGRASDLANECRRVDDFIRNHGLIDISIVGIGMNGHIGMNEPGTPASLRSYIAAIHPNTQQVGQKYFTQRQQLDTGITLGLKTILESAHIFLLANGSHKAEIISRMLTDAIGEQLPATLLRRHESFSIYLDKEAASLIRH